MCVFVLFWLERCECDWGGNCLQLQLSRADLLGKLAVPTSRLPEFENRLPWGLLTLIANGVLRTVPPWRPFHSLRGPWAFPPGCYDAVPFLRRPPPTVPSPSLPSPLIFFTRLYAAAVFSNEEVLARASLQLDYITCHCFWSKDHPGKGLEVGTRPGPVYLTSPAPLELRGGTRIWTLQELTAPRLALEPNVQDACSSLFVKFQQTGLSQRSLLGAFPRMLAPSWCLAFLIWVAPKCLISQHHPLDQRCLFA